MNVRPPVLALLLIAVTVCAGCGGSSPAPVTAPAVSAAPFSVSPSSILIGVPSIPALLDVSNAPQAITARADNPLVAAVGVRGSKVIVTPIAAGQATITLSSGASSVSVPLTVSLCTPPNPTFTLASPANGAAGVSTSTGTIVLALQSAHTYTQATIVSSIVARVVTSTGTDVVTNAPLQAVAAPPGAPPGGQYFSFAVPSLPAVASFTVQAYVASEPCLPASTIGAGTFST
jgi:hypothetical protein